MRIVIASQDFPPSTGGVQTWTSEIARALAHAHDVHVVAPQAREAERFDADFPAPVLRVPGSSDTMFVRGAPALIAAVRKLRPDLLLHAQWTSAAIAPLLRARGWCRALGIAAHGRELLLRTPFAALAHDRARRELLGRADVVFAVSRYTAGLCAGLGVRNVHVVRGGVALGEFDPVRWQPAAQAFRATHGLGLRPLVVSVARLLPHKGIDTAIAALARVRAVVADAVYVVVGDGPDRERLRQLAAPLGDAVRFVGRSSDHDRCAAIAAADAFAMLSRDASPAVEGFGLVALEAAALGVPVVGGDSGGVRDALLDGELGRLVDPLDVDACARAFIEVLGNDAQLRGEQLRARVSATSSWRHTADAIVWRTRSLLADRHHDITRS